MNTTIKDIDTYISKQPILAQPALKKVRETISKAAPKATELISYGMPAFKYNGMLAYFAGFKKHYSVFVPQSLDTFKDEVEPYRTSKATLQFDFDKPVPVRLITKLVKHAVKVNAEKALLKNKKK
ncbi:iron chaperone [Ferruginibacter sp. SUN002]|uniref:iron chaperone n=1 Tax=Ferruginibacter sp. SUN002 TaxID=2937789 RepID=UPI003D36D11A